MIGERPHQPLSRRIYNDRTRYILPSSLCVCSSLKYLMVVVVASFIIHGHTAPHFIRTVSFSPVPFFFFFSNIFYFLAGSNIWLACAAVYLYIIYILASIATTTTLWGTWIQRLWRLFVSRLETVLLAKERSYPPKKYTKNFIRIIIIKKISPLSLKVNIIGTEISGQ